MRFLQKTGSLIYAVMLFGALVPGLYAGEGVLSEGNNPQVLKESGYQLNVILPNHQKQSFELKPGKSQLPLALKGVKSSIEVFDRAIEQMTVKEEGQGAGVNHAIKVTLQSKKMGTSETLWLVEKSPLNAESNRSMIGPAQLILKERIDTKSDPTIPFLRVLNKSGQELVAVDLTQALPEQIALKDSDHKIVHLNYYPYARVGDGNKLVNSPGSGSPNPAVEFDIVDGKGNQQHYIKFALFPDFEAMHDKAEKKIFDVSANLSGFENAKDLIDNSSLIFYFGKDGKWTYETTAEGGTLREGQIIPDQWILTGWMDFSFRVEQMLGNAAVSTEVVNSPKKEGVLAAEISIDKGSEHFTQWVTEGQAVGFKTDQGEIRFELAVKSRDLL